MEILNLYPNPSKILVTGSAGFIGYHLSELLLSEGYQVCGYDGFTNYYDVKLKEDRHKKLKRHSLFNEVIGMLEDQQKIDEVFDDFQPDVVIHLAAQASVRYSLENPRAYIEANIFGTFNIMDASRRLNVKHLLMASTSSVYGANRSMPFSELEKADTQLTIYAATKKANESMAHSYANLWKLPVTMFRFFTVYGTWGRPDLALYKFVDAILKDKPIDIYNHGEMYRDFTYVTDLVKSIRLLVDKVPDHKLADAKIINDSISPVAPFRVVNIGNSNKVRLLDFIDAIERALGKKAKRNYMEMQKGDVPATWADCTLLKQLIDYQPDTKFQDGIDKFVQWYLAYYGKKES